MLTTRAEVKKYVMDTIRTGNKERIQLVLKRYNEYVRENKNSAEKLVQKVFGDVIR